MKKVYLILLLVLSVSDLMAQKLMAQKLPNVQIGRRITSYNAIRESGNEATTGAKSTATGSRWYTPFELIDNMNGNIMSLGAPQFVPMWFDSTILDVYQTGAAKINYCSMAQVIDPISSPFLFDSSRYNGMLNITAADVYHVDSVSIQGAYFQSNRPANIVDTFIISVAPSVYARYWLKSQNPWASAYLPAAQDTLWAFVPCLIDSITRSAYSDLASAPRAIWKVPLTDAMRDPGNPVIRNYKFVVPNGGIDIPAGYRTAVTFTFKSGDTWIPNVDTIFNFHHFLCISGEPSGGGLMPNYDYLFGDSNGSSFLFSNDTTFYFPTYAIESLTSPFFPDEFLNIGAKMSCSTCKLLKVNESVQQTLDFKVYPNPANDAIAITTNSNTAITMVITNVVGQELKRSIIKGGTASTIVSVKDYKSGIYFCTIDSDGKTATQKFIVNH